MSLARLAVTGATVATVLSATSMALATDYYIDPAGSDSNSGTSESEPWATLDMVRQAGSGDTVYLKRGGSWQGSLSVSGTTVSAYGTGDRPTIVATGGGFGGISVQSNATVIGVKVEGEARTGISVSGSGSEVRDCEVDGSAGYLELGFGIMGEGNLIIGNSVHDLSGMTGDSGDMNSSGGAEAYMVMASDNEIAYNSAVNCWGPNETLGGAEGGCLEIVNGEANSVIENVHFHHNYCERSVGLFEGCSGNFSGADAIQENHGIIRNCSVSYNIAVDAMWLYLLQPVNTDFENVLFEHNTIIHTPVNEDIPQGGGASFGLLVNEDQGYNFELSPGDITVRNNLFAVVNGGASGMFSPPPAGDSYNNVFSPSAPMGADLGTGSFAVEDPGLTADYRVAEGSPLIDVATADLPYSEDIDGKPVSCGDAPDIGASEYCEDSEGTGGTAGSASTDSGGDSSTAGGATVADATGGDTSTADGAGGSSAGGDAPVTGSGGASTAGGAAAVTCAEGLTLCGDVCVDLTANATHCGACGVGCAAGQVCSAGVCTSACAAGLTQCDQGCVDLSTDILNCGACGATCLTGQVCTGGQCTGTATGGDVSVPVAVGPSAAGPAGFDPTAADPAATSSANEASAGAAAVATVAPTNSDSGCGCVTAATRTSRIGAALSLLLGLLLLRRRRPRPC